MNEVKLIKQCQLGNKDAFNELITLYYPFIFRYLVKLVCNEEIAKDILQETFLKLIKNIDKYEIRGNVNFSTYLITIAKNTYLDYLKKNNNYNSNIDIDTVSDQVLFTNKIDFNEDINIVMQEIDNLPEEQRIAIKLKYLDGYTLSEIAKLRNTKPDTIKSRIHEGKKKIKNGLKRRKFLWIQI